MLRAMFGMGGSEILVILIIALIFLGPDKLPDAAKQISKGIRDLKKLKKAVGDGKKVAFESDAERRYARGLALMQAGDPDGAKEEWRAVQAFAGVDVLVEVA